MSKYAIKINAKKISTITADTAEAAARAYSDEKGPNSDFGFMRGVKMVDAETRGAVWAIIRTDGGEITAERI